ncbi:MAG: MBL fold metallo-hydrolase [Clostridia bacterium]|nr:MBL fold metallo-hydrolase [Clostridia bacterium]
MKIEYLGHSCFKLTESTGTSVVCDPYDSSIGYDMPKVCADAVTVSHRHYDHDNIGAVSGNPVIIDGECNHELDGVQISAVKSFHDGQRGKVRGENLIFKFRMDGIDICHLGDLGEACSSELIELLLPVDVLLIPVGGNYTVDAEMAKEYVDRLMPNVVIPMHYRDKGCKLDIEKVDDFLQTFDEEDIEEIDGSEIEFTRREFDGFDNTRVIVLRRRND